MRLDCAQVAEPSALLRRHFFLVGALAVLVAIFATMVTLFVAPVFYNLLARFTKSPQATARRIETFEESERARAAAAE
jgi:multidrug efflux pump